MQINFGNLKMEQYVRKRYNVELLVLTTNSLFFYNISFYLIDIFVIM